LKFC